MNNHLVPSSSTSVQKAFNWDETIAETKALIEEDAELTATIEEAQIRRFEVRVCIGFNLMALQEYHSRKGGGSGDFTTVVLPNLEIDDRSFAHRCIRVAKLYQLNVAHGQHSIPALPVRAWDHLAAPSTPPVVIEQVLSGEIEATQKAIKDAIDKAKQAEKDKDELQRSFNLFKQQTEQEKTQQAERIQQELNLKNQELALLNRQKQLRDQEYATLEAEKERIEQSKVQILQEDTPETKAKLEEAEQKLQRLEEQEKNLKEKNKQKNEQLQQKIDRIKELTNEIQSYNRDNQLIAHNKEIRFKWQQACDAFHLGINQGFTRMVTPIDARQAFEPDDWARLAELEATLKQAIEKLSGLRESMTSQFVDASIVEG